MRTVTTALILALSSVLSAQGLGTHDQFESDGITLMGWIPNGEFANFEGADDCWGYTSPSGREYAIIGTTGAIGFAEITNPSEPVIVASLPAPNNNWHDIKTYRSYAYSVSEGGGGIKVFKLNRIDQGIVSNAANITSGGALGTHNLAIDTTSGFLYRCDGAGFNGLRIYSLANPEFPSLVGSWTVRGVHDAQVVTYDSGVYAGKQIGFLASDALGFRGLTIVDLTSKENIQILGSVEYPNQAVAHQGWLSADKSIFYYGDEADEISFAFSTRTHMFDVSDLSNPTYIGLFSNGNSASDHNLYTKGSLIFEANFMSGLRVFDATNPTSPVEVAHFDTQLSSDDAKTEGLWSNYPFFPSGTIIGSDEVKGLFIWRLGEPKLTYSFPSGLPDPISPDGESIRVHIDEETLGDMLPGSLTLHVVDSGVEVSSPLVDIGSGDFLATVPASSCGEVLRYRFTARSTDNLLWRSPASTEDDYHYALAAYSETPLVDYNMELDAGWTGGVAGDTANDGMWERGTPNGTAAQSEIDHTPGAGMTACWFTEQSTPGLDNGIRDVDGGTTTLLSPALNLSGTTDPHISYWRWFHNAGGANPDDDAFVVEVSNNGSNWVNVETVGPTGPDVRGGWRRHAFRVQDFVTLTSNVRVRFLATDSGPASVVEAAVDDFRVFETSCGDCNGNGIDDTIDLMSGSSLDLDGNGMPDECQPFSADVATISLSTGGTQSMVLDAGAAHEFMFYRIFGGFSGTSPGLQLGNVLFPINYDEYFALTLSSPKIAPFGGFKSNLDENGKSTASLTLLPATDPSLAGVTVHHAFVAAEILGDVNFASNVITVTLVP